MRLAKVIGNIWATQKYGTLQGRRHLLIQPLTFSGKKSGTPIVALDTVDAGQGDVVIFATSYEAAIPFKPNLTPTDATVVGVVDDVTTTTWSYSAGD